MSSVAAVTPIRPAVDVDVAPAGTTAPTLAPRNLRPLGQILLEDGAVEQGDLLKALVMRRRQNVQLGQILLAQGWVTPQALSRALSRQWRTGMIDPAESPADPRLIDLAGADFCLTHNVLPWRRIGGVTWVATSDPDEFAALIPKFPAGFGAIRMLLADEAQIQDAVLATRRIALTRRAELRVPADESCRMRNEVLFGRLAVTLIALAALSLWLVPVALLGVFLAVVTTGLVAQSGMKLLAFIATLRTARDDRRQGAGLASAALKPAEMDATLPVISVMVPLFQESDVAGRLVARLARLSYPRELTDILLVIEASDHVTRKALKGAALPRWLRVVEVPDGPIKTKPRALNYALNFCRGQIVGIWDAEDRPDPDQLHRIARHFHFAGPRVGCVQGALDFYNPRSNWLARCFTVEYTAWFLVLLPGIARLGLVVPLGGTTCFFRREALEDVDAWDAWNVTEDADLGVRLARRGWQTQIVQTTTDEEANCRVVPWIKQRSRWIKGFAMTWGVHMRRPGALWHDLGPRRFVGFQVQFLAMLTQYLLAPMLWSFWLLAAGLPHPLRDALDGTALSLLIGLFVGSELLNLVIGLYAVRGAKHRHLLAWVPTLHVYFPLGCAAGLKALYEVVLRPFYWDKTAHGLFDEAETEAAPQALPGTVSLPVLGQISGRALSEIPGQRRAIVQQVATPQEPELLHARAG
ncbi:glycosyltransferase [Paracoccus sp. (in: a-proteobacteria)]|uniref:glycosyltransferase n=1 Tax=Paracoccus sp. TaxID=267 RepID=UPI003A89E1E2